MLRGTEIICYYTHYFIFKYNKEMVGNNIFFTLFHCFMAFKTGAKMNVEPKGMLWNSV